MIDNIGKGIRHIPKTHACIVVGLLTCPPRGGKNIHEAWHTTVRTALSQLRHLDITGPGLKWNCADGLQRQRYLLLAAWVRDYPEQVMIAKVPSGSYPMCEIPKCVLMGHSTIRPLDISRDQHTYSELLQDNDLNALHMLGFHPIRNQFWQYPLCNVYRHWQHDELHQLLLGFGKDLFHWLLQYLNARQIKNQFENRFTLVQQYPGFQHLTKPFDHFKSGTRHGKEIRAMIRTLAIDCAPILVWSTDDGKTGAGTASDEMAVGAVWVLSEHSLLVSQQNHSDRSLAAHDDALK
jgi:hypothetical protein